MFFGSSKKQAAFKYSDLSSREQKKIIEKSVRQANQEQKTMVEEFDKRFGGLE